MLICIFAGIIIGCIIFKRFPNLFSKDKKIKEVIKDPYLLAEKLKSNGKIYDMGKEIEIRVGKDSETGQDVVMVEEKEAKRSKEIQKKIMRKPKKKSGKKTGKKK